MAEATFTFRLVTPQRLVLETPIVALQAPGSEGYLGVLAHHAPLITTLRPGRLEVRDEAGKRSIYVVGGGFLEVSGNRATVLADSAELASEIDAARAKASLSRAESRLKGDGGAAAVDRERATRAMERAKARLALVISERE
ncbi:MAG TPA: ATP synthase F1 subunit epsilon [Candidatus Eisenbacteria bacterium]|nr:ATP synthase F1 subunit epsilon [Candidatus Eisenbacteria bacterium]